MKSAAVRSEDLPGDALQFVSLCAICADIADHMQEYERALLSPSGDQTGC
jgi:hypothetical protein